MDNRKLLEDSCTVSRKRSHNEEHDFVPLESELGQAFMEVHDRLESYNNEEWGPWETLLDLLKKKCKDDNCSEETQRGYLIWAIVVTVALVLCILLSGIVALIVASSRGTRTPTGGGRTGGGAAEADDAKARMTKTYGASIISPFDVSGVRRRH